MKNPDPLLVKNLTKKYSSKTAVDQVSFSIQPGEVFGLLGPNGAGKTTIISTIMTLQNATSGTIEVTMPVSRSFEVLLPPLIE